MTKLEKVINGLACWVKSATAARECDGDCPYRTTVEEEQVMGECNWPNLFKDALELLKAISWVNANDRLPKHEQDVLAYANGQMFVMSYNASRNDWEDDYGYYQGSDYVEFWMPLPEPPKEEVHE